MTDLAPQILEELREMRKEQSRLLAEVAALRAGRGMGEMVGRKEVCRLLGISPSTLDRWWAEKRISKGTMVGNARKWPRVEIETLVIEASE